MRFPASRVTAPGLFATDSQLRRVAEGSVGLLGGGRALLLQLAHPLVAAGVAEHSRFRENPLGRLDHTLTLIHNIILGDHRQAQVALRQFHARHAHITGQLPHTVGSFAAGTPYSAQDPQLRLWVHATLVDTALTTHERFIAPLSPMQRTRFYDDSRLLAQHFGIPLQLVPPTLETFRTYMQGMYASNTLTVSDNARRLAVATVMAPDVWFGARLSARLICFITAGLLPAPIRVGYGFRWHPIQQLTLDCLSQIICWLYPFWHGALYHVPFADGHLIERILRTGKTRVTKS
jgi:uncharacterized protein (DUF2236 family)